MTNLLVASRNAGLHLALSRSGHEVVELPGVEGVIWDDYLGFADVVVLDLDDPSACGHVVEDLVATASHDVRVLMLTTDRPEWKQIVRPQKGLAFLELPLTLPRLGEALEILVSGAPLVAGSASTISPARAESTAVVDLTGSADAPSSPSSQPAPPARPRLSPADVTVHAQVAVAAPVKVPAASVSPEGSASSSRPRTVGMVRALAAASDELASVADTAEVILDEAMKLIPSEGGAVLVADGDVWRVAAGVNLRSLEERLLLSPEHWLVSRTMTSSGLILRPGSGRLSEFYGVPLSESDHVLSAPLPPAHALLLLARDERDFEQDDLQTLLPFGDEAGHLLADAVDIRQLARLLSDFREEHDY